MLKSLKDWWNKQENKWLAYVVVGIFVLGGYFVVWWPPYEAEKRRQELRGRIEELKASTANEADKLTLERDLFQMEKDLGVYESANRTAALQVIGGFFLILGAYLAWRNVKAKEESNEIERTTRAEENVTERFSKAVEMLGSDQMDVRIGAVYVLERIARDSKKDYPAVMEILAAFARENSKKREAERKAALEEKIADGEEGSEPTERLTEELNTIPGVQADIQICMTVISSLWNHKYGHGRAKLDEVGLSVGILPVPDLSGAVLASIDLHKSYLNWVDFAGAHLEGADLFGARLERADLTTANLEGAVLRFAHLEGTDLSGAHLESANLWGAHLEGANLTRANLNGANLFGAHLEGANLTRANLNGANLFGAHLEGAYLSEAHLEGAILLSEIIGAVEGLTESQLRSAIIDKTTIVPPEFEALKQEILAGKNGGGKKDAAPALEKAVVPDSNAPAQAPEKQAPKQQSKKPPRKKNSNPK